jgi:hypothetical protein
MASGKAEVLPTRSRCAHCEMPIVDESTMVSRAGQTFCCNNCAAAMSAGATHKSA